MSFMPRRQVVDLSFHEVRATTTSPLEAIEVHARDRRTSEIVAALSIKDMGAWLAKGGFRPIIGLPIWERTL